MKKIEPELMTIDTKFRLEADLKSIQAKILEKNLASGEALDNSGDWHDNAARDVLFQELQVLGGQEKKILEYLASPKIINPRFETTEVGIGNTVRVRYEGETDDETFTILGRPDSLTEPSWISYESTLGKALIGKHEGEKILIPPSQIVTLVKILVGQFK